MVPKVSPSMNIAAMQVTPESLRVALDAVPEVGEMHINEVLGGYLVLNVPQFNKDGKPSKRPPKRFILISPEVFAENFVFTTKKARRMFAEVAFR